MAGELVAIGVLSATEAMHMPASQLVWWFRYIAERNRQQPSTGDTVRIEK